jgi:hypothetical protein
MIRIALSVLALLTSACATAPPKTPEQDVEAFMHAYTVAWNKHDAAAIARDFYRMGNRTVEEQTVASRKSFDDLIAQGYDHSDIHQIKTDGTPLPPKDRASAYELKKFPDGWRMTRVLGADAAKPLECPPKA